VVYLNIQHSPDQTYKKISGHRAAHSQCSLYNYIFISNSRMGFFIRPNDLIYR